MKKKLVFVLATFAVIACWTFAADTPVEKAATLEELHTKVAALEKRLSELESRIQAGQFVSAPLVVPPGNLDLTPPLQPGENPKTWGEIEANGLKFYIFPLSASR